MKIAHINCGRRGIASYALNLYDYFAPLGHETLVVSEAKWTKRAIPVYEPKSSLIADILPWAHHPRQVTEKLVEFAPDILHHHFPCGRLDLHVDTFQKRLGVPMLVTPHLSVGSKKYFIDWVMHNVFMFEKRHFKDALCYVAISKFVRDQLYKIGGLPPERVVLLYAGVDTQVYKPAPKNRSDALEVVFCGQIMPEKGIDGLIGSVLEVAKSRKIRLSIIGDGNLEALLRKRTKEQPSINWVGFVRGPEKVSALYAEADCVVLPTRWDEAFSYIPLEALSSGTMVIASRTGGNVEAIAEGKTGYLFEKGNFKELAEILKKLDKAHAADMGAAGRQYILKHHTIDLFGQKYKALYENLVEHPDDIKQVEG